MAMLNPGPLSSLLKPALFLHVRHSLQLPVFLLAAVVGVLAGTIAAVVRGLNIIGPNGLVVGIDGLFQALPGFYIAALAAIATFDGSKRGYDLDEVWPKPSPWIWEADGNRRYLTRRHFLSLLFGYLSFASLLLYLGGVVTGVLAPVVHSAGAVTVTCLRAIFAGVYVASVAHVVETTFVGLYFLAHRFHSSAMPPPVSRLPANDSRVLNLTKPDIGTKPQL